MSTPEGGVTRPRRRFQLHAKIISLESRGVKEFSDDICVDLATMSRIINGWVTPGPKMQQRLAKHLSISLKELSGLL